MNEKDEYEKLLDSSMINKLPKVEMYYRSYMHKENVQFVASSPRNDFFITMSRDGIIKFWHKIENELEFVKQIPTQEVPFSTYSISFDEQFIATGNSNGKVFIFRIKSYEMVAKFDYHIPADMFVQFVHDPTTIDYRLAITHTKTQSTWIVNPLEVGTNKEPPKPINEFKLLTDPIAAMSFSKSGMYGVSIDINGLVMFWDLFGKNPTFDYDSIFKTNYLELASIKSDNKKVQSIALSSDGKLMAVCCSDWTVKLFDVASGLIKRRFTEALDGEKMYGLQQEEYQARVLQEKRFRSENEFFNVAFDDSGVVLAVPSAFGLKFYSTKTRSLLRIIGRVEKQERFNSVAIYEGKLDSGPMAVLTAFERQRFYVFTDKSPENAKRDAMNERVIDEKIGHAATKQRYDIDKLPRVAIIHTEKGSIKVELFPELCPLAVENFTQHAKRGYYDNIRIHRVVRDFCIQTGDPLGSGVGGESIWGEPFEDESLDNGRTFDEPGMLAMANFGPNTNGSQFFITTKPAPHLNGKHSVFGHVIDGMDVIHAIELVETDNYNHPTTPVMMINITFSSM